MSCVESCVQSVACARSCFDVPFLTMAYQHFTHIWHGQKQLNYSASRIPSGLLTARALHKLNTLGVLCYTLGTLRDHFWSSVPSLEALWERCGALLMTKSGLRHQRCPKGRHPRNSVIFRERFGGDFWGVFQFVAVCF